VSRHLKIVGWMYETGRLLAGGPAAEEAA